MPNYTVYLFGCLVGVDDDGTTFYDHAKSKGLEPALAVKKAPGGATWLPAAGTFEAADEKSAIKRANESYHATVDAAELQFDRFAEFQHAVLIEEAD